MIFLRLRNLGVGTVDAASHPDAEIPIPINVYMYKPVLQYDCYRLSGKLHQLIQQLNSISFQGKVHEASHACTEAKHTYCKMRTKGLYPKSPKGHCHAYPSKQLDRMRLRQSDHSRIGTLTLVHLRGLMSSTQCMITAYKSNGKSREKPTN